MTRPGVVKLPGLLVEVTNVSPGKGTYLLRYKSPGRTKYIKIGRTYDISLADAKKKALQLKAEITTGGELLVRLTCRLKKNF